LGRVFGVDSTGSPQALTIRQARDDELDIVASLTVDAYAEYAARMSPDAWSSFAQDIANVRGRLGDAHVLIAERSGHIVGSVSVYTDWRGAQAGSFGVRLLAVPPQHRGQGVGRALMEHALDWAKSSGVSRVVMLLTPDMESARELSEELGFSRDQGLDHEPAPGVRMQGYALSVS